MDTLPSPPWPPPLPSQERTFYTQYSLKYQTNGGYMMDVSVLFDGRETQHRVIVGEACCGSWAGGHIYACAPGRNGAGCGAEVAARQINRGGGGKRVRTGCHPACAVQRHTHTHTHTPARAARWVCVCMPKASSMCSPPPIRLTPPPPVLFCVACCAPVHAGKHYYEPHGLQPEVAAEAGLALLLRAKVGRSSCVEFLPVDFWLWL